MSTRGERAVWNTAVSASRPVYVHFRNLKGGYLHFQETFPDDGDVDMLRALRVYKEVGYDGMIMPDHVPHIEGDANGAQAFAYAFGYIQALIQMLKSEAA